MCEQCLKQLIGSRGFLNCSFHMNASFHDGVNSITHIMSKKTDKKEDVTKIRYIRLVWS